MTLFSIKDIANEKPTTYDSKLASGSKLMAITNSVESLRDTLSVLAPDMVVKYYTNGAWSMHQMLEYLVQITGPAELVMSTWTITEDPARSLLKLRESGQLTAIHALFDYRVRERSPGAHQILQGICNSLALGHCHAKVLVLTNDTWTMSVVGSANFSRNKRLEAGTIFTRPEDAAFDRTMLMAEIEEATR